MRFPLGKKGLVAAGAVVGALAFWRIRARRREREDLEWEAEVADAIQEGRSSGETATASEGS
ncbi:MAG: hypothetical protein JOY80_08075 [Candidatus Dormibacteraeota bacterium]|nr:hypothetical protein [Candidatus Dormibacteraeota bacterium]